MKRSTIFLFIVLGLLVSACESGDVEPPELYADGSWSQVVNAVDGFPVDPFVIEGCFEQLGLGCSQSDYGNDEGIGVPDEASYMQPLCMQTYNGLHAWFHGCVVDKTVHMHRCWTINSQCAQEHTNHHVEDPTIWVPLDY